jgi:hypothetical protein
LFWDRISGRGIEVDRARSNRKLSYPRDIRGIRSFLGHASFYRKFIKYF